ncbi:IS110 family transposase [Microcoleus sp. BR0-C5]|uniref:IS110 family transposase n=1 Tax=Microcoleus sp. BR0-C5 TaxID=2818713 RepID=UPI002FD606FB
MSSLHLNVGVDVSKDTLDLCFFAKDQIKHSFTVKNSPAGFEQIVKKLEKMAPKDQWRITMEATSSCHKALVWHLAEEGVPAVVMAPNQARSLAKGLGIIRKNDATDAYVLAVCSQKNWKTPRKPPTKEQAELQELSRRIDSLKAQAADEKKRMGKPSACAELIKSCTRVIRLLDKEIQQVSQLWLVKLKQSQELVKKHRLMLSIPGVGPETARKVLSELFLTDELKNVKQCIAYAGLAPQECSSGTSLNRKATIHGTGSRFLRTALFMGAISCSRHDAECSAHYDRMLEAGKPKKCALVAIMARMLRRIVTVVNRGTEWTPTP